MHEKIIKKLCQNGYQAFIAGGAVRDYLMGEEPKDIDITTSATPEEVYDLFSKDYRVDIVGKSFLVAIVNGIEVATFRKDRYFGLSAKNCTIEKAECVQDDLSRRDLSINAMALCSLSGDLIDEFGGVSDLLNKTIRFVGNPNKRIHEDPCRIIRACRFLAKIDGHFDPYTFDSLRRYSHYIKTHVAPDRIRMEVLKAMNCQTASKFFIALDLIGALQYIFPSLYNTIGVWGGPHHAETVFEHCMLVGDNISTKCPYLKLAGYLHDVGKPSSFNQETQNFAGHDKTGAELVYNDLKALKFSVKEIYYIKTLIEFHMRQINNETKPKTIRKFITELHKRNIHYSSWLRLKIADRKGNLNRDPYSFDQIINIITSIESEIYINNTTQKPLFSIKDLAITGKDVMDILNIPQGPQVGKILKDVFELILENPSLNDKETLIDFITLKETKL